MALLPTPPNSPAPPPVHAPARPLTPLRAPAEDDDPMDLDEVLPPVFPATRVARPLVALKRSDAILADSAEEFLAKIAD
jgi:hypothetical protein